jgi:four helix bundle protein
MGIEPKTPLESPRYDLEIRTFRFAQRVRAFVRALPVTPANALDTKQLVRSSGSVGANYLEANETMTKKDFISKISTAVREAKESAYWLQLVYIGINTNLEQERKILWVEAQELLKILGSILHKTKTKRERKFAL